MQAPAEKQNNIFTTYAKSIAILWTLLIFFLCFIPGKDLPHLNIPLVDKWTHMVLFGVFTILWHNTARSNSMGLKLILFIAATFLGWLVEYVQGHYVQGRSQDNMDTLADAVGGLIGIILFSIYVRFNKSTKSQRG
ncbi:MAG: VanZ family protein [Flavipsychrobacter sp.]